MRHEESQTQGPTTDLDGGWTEKKRVPEGWTSSRRTPREGGNDVIGGRGRTPPLVRREGCRVRPEEKSGDTVDGRSGESQLGRRRTLSEALSPLPSQPGPPTDLVPRPRPLPVKTSTTQHGDLSGVPSHRGA